MTIVDAEGRVFFPCYGCGSEEIAWEYQAGDDPLHVFAFCKPCLALLDRGACLQAGESA